MPLARIEEATAAMLARTVIIGTSCAGKTTLARRLGAALAVRSADLDEVHWLPGWQEKPLDRFRAEVAELAAGERWFVAGNYPRVRDVLWPRATAVVCLDYGFDLVWQRALSRTIHRVATRERLFGGNREGLAKALSRDGILWWVLTTWRRRRRSFDELFARDEHPHLRLLRLRGQEDADALCERLGA